MSKEKQPDLEAEPVVIYNGQKSDISEHAPMLSNEIANRMADDMAADQARVMGWSEADIKRFVYGD
jgi:hypothetical protein